MSVPINILDKSTNRSAIVTNRGQLVIAPLDFSTLSFQNLSTDDVAENFFKPLAGKRFVITDVIVETDRNVGVNGATVDILNIITTEGKFINGKTDDNNVLLSIGGYFVSS